MSNFKDVRNDFWKWMRNSNESGCPFAAKIANKQPPPSIKSIDNYHKFIQAVEDLYEIAPYSENSEWWNGAGLSWLEKKNLSEESYGWPGKWGKKKQDSVGGYRKKRRTQTRKLKHTKRKQSKRRKLSKKRQSTKRKKTKRRRRR
jgi:hypothetical protein